MTSAKKWNPDLKTTSKHPVFYIFRGHQSSFQY